MDDYMNDEILGYIFENLDDAVLVTSKNGEIQYLNQAAIELFEITPDVVGKSTIWDAIPFVKKNDDLVQLFIDALAETPKSQRATVSYVNKAKKTYQLWVSVVYLPYNSGMFVIVINDLTEFSKVNAAFERYTSPQIADYVLNDPKGAKQGGESRDVTILMSDLRGYTAMSAELTPDQMIKSLNHYFQKMVDIIERYEGTVIEFLGDGIFVVFGAPKEDPLHAEHAVACAVEMQNALYADREWYDQKGYPEMEMGIGINSGPAIVGNIGSKTKMKYGVMGYTVNLAGRIESLTIGGQIFISENTRSLLKDELVIKAQNDVMFKGAAESLTVYDICGIGKHNLTNTQTDEISWNMLSPELEVTFSLLTGKQVEKETHPAKLLAVSENTHFACLSTEYELKKGDNIMISTEIDLYAKVINPQDDGYVISFTMRTEGFSDWAKRLFR